MNRIVRRGALSIGVGSLFPLVYLIAYGMGIVHEFPRWGQYLWPSSIFLMATGGAENNRSFVAEVIGLSLLANAILWLALGLLCFGLFDLWRRRKSPARAFKILANLPGDLLAEGRVDAPPQKRKNL
jgi:hypothetical protein